MSDYAVINPATGDTAVRFRTRSHRTTRPADGLPALAVRAHAENLEAVADLGVAVHARGVVGPLLDRRSGYLHGAAAPTAHEVVVVPCAAGAVHRFACVADEHVDVTGIRSSAFMLMYGVVWVSLIWMYWTEVRQSPVIGPEAKSFSLQG